MRFLTAITLVVLLSSIARAADVALVGGAVYAAPDSARLDDAVVLVRDGVILEIGARTSVRVPDGFPVIDCSGRWIVAGFWNSHVHLITPGLLNVREKSNDVLQPQLDQMFNRWGFTAIFDLASNLQNTLAMRERVENHDLRGPRVLTCGDPLWTEVPVYVRDFLVEHQIEMPVVRSPGEAEAQVSALQQGGAHGVKLFTGSVQRAGAVANMPGEIVRAASRAAQQHDLPVFAHAQNTAGLEVAIAGGVNVLAHTTPQSALWTPEQVERLRQADVALIPTLTLALVEGRRAQLPASVVEGWLNLIVEQLRVYAAAGGDILFGTDAGYIDEFDTTREFELMVRAGLDFPQILASLTTTPARRFGTGRDSGRLQAGAPADLVVLGSDPAVEIKALADVQLTLRAGRVTFQTGR